MSNAWFKTNWKFLFAFTLVWSIALLYLVKTLYQHHRVAFEMQDLMQGKQTTALTAVTVYHGNDEILHIDAPDELITVTKLLQSVDPEWPPYAYGVFKVRFHFGELGYYESSRSYFNDDFLSLSLPGWKPVEPGWPSHFIPVPDELRSEYQAISERIKKESWARLFKE